MVLRHSRLALQLAVQERRSVLQVVVRNNRLVVLLSFTMKKSAALARTGSQRRYSFAFKYSKQCIQQTDRMLDGHAQENKKYNKNRSDENVTRQSFVQAVQTRKTLVPGLHPSVEPRSIEIRHFPPSLPHTTIKSIIHVLRKPPTSRNPANLQISRCIL